MLEAEELVGHEFNEEEDYLFAVREMVELGAAEAIMTVPDGCVAQVLPEEGSTTPRHFRARVTEVEATATIGSGDAFLAGYVAARYTGSQAPECLAYGVACGAESTQHLGAGVVDPAQVERLLSDVEVTPLVAPFPASSYVNLAATVVPPPSVGSSRPP
jgi:fructose-1-phosphate kinase PfkB-like protein